MPCGKNYINKCTSNKAISFRKMLHTLAENFMNSSYHLQGGHNIT